MTATDKIKEHLSKWQRIDEAIAMPNWTKDANEEARRFYYNNSTVHRKVIKKLVEALERQKHPHVEELCRECAKRETLAECAEMLEE